MPRGPKGEKRPADEIRAPASWSAGIISPFAFIPSSRLLTSDFSL
jgi:hypothetical protein